MSTKNEEFNILKPKLLGTWIAQRDSIWQLDFLSDRKLGSLASKLGLMSLSLGDHVKRLWLYGLLRADLIMSNEPLNWPKLVQIQHDSEGKYYYADERFQIEREAGIDLSTTSLENLPSGIQLFFHPFRYYVLYHIDRIIRPHIHPMQMLLSPKSYPKLLDREIVSFQNWLTNCDGRSAIDRWNNITSLAVAVEPFTFEKIFGVFRYSAFSSEEDQRQLIDQHWTECSEILKNVSVEQIETVRNELCTNAEILEPNRNIHTILRLTEGDWRLKSMRGRLGGAIYLLTMAEMLRRSAEKIFSIELPEEDELGFGMAPLNVKKELYGANRLLDSNRSVRNNFLRQFNLDHGVRLRWYVEGETEYGALNWILGWERSIEIINLGGNVIEKRGKGVAFRDSLNSDIRSQIFSFVSLDGDRKDNIRVIRKAAEDDEICGMFFINKPDFEIANFSVEELAKVAKEMGKESGIALDELEKLNNINMEISSGKEFFKAIKQIVPMLNQIDKSEDWGEKLMIYAWHNPEMIVSDDTIRTRPIVDAVTSALRSIMADYHLTRREYRVDPTSGKPIKRNAPGENKT